MMRLSWIYLIRKYRRSGLRQAADFKVTVQRFHRKCKAHGEETVSDKPAFLIDTEHMYCAKLKDISFYAVRPVNASDAADKKVSAKKTAVKENNKKTGTKAAVSTKKKKEKVIQHRYFGVRRAKALYPSYENLPIVLNTPRECDVIASNVFSYLQKESAE